MLEIQLLQKDFDAFWPPTPYYIHYRTPTPNNLLPSSKLWSSSSQTSRDYYPNYFSALFHFSQTLQNPSCCILLEEQRGCTF